MYNFLCIQYRLGRVTAAQLAALVGVHLTAEQYEAITGEACDES